VVQHGYRVQSEASQLVKEASAAAVAVETRLVMLVVAGLAVTDLTVLVQLVVVLTILELVQQLLLLEQPLDRFMALLQSQGYKENINAN
jgi:hypothetical protein